MRAHAMGRAVPCCSRRQQEAQAVLALPQHFHRFVRALGGSPENPDNQETAGGCRYQGDCRNGFHGSKSDRQRVLPTVPKVIESTGSV
jgi:hypothetical protein